MPGDLIGALPVNSVIHPADPPIIYLHAQVLRRPVGSTQYTSADYTQALDDAGVLASVGTVGDA